MKRTSGIVKWITNLHAVEGKPMTKSVVLELCKMVEVMKGLQIVFQRHIVPLVHIIFLVTQHITHQALAVITATKVSLLYSKIN